MIPITTNEARALAQAELRRIAELEAAGLLNRIHNYGALGPVRRLAIARGTAPCK
ncbi:MULTISPECIES: hypothetical protein [unclassified Pseudomonas]|uniref:hypothetical protein n=1 Tax=unclassified Pseudomonas TaxID=196821 RepID=UPI000BD4C075|nr:MULTISPECIES: hypothetical protein [unclassified Pseudomonas]PVZ19969.1 hypothetical protein F474_00560 [Pseudomonas sp. URIL14HWK12:I12]PVZ27035.1 hypothetical protein F470_00215 [Pseudomonas sp. URIL14HWK12:I10]PVZ37924.1 hypothetical protein F472_00560 [Pseudomonas sp. URIL14HWK12:I11]SNZ05122.1 hypothetical protein SAMN05660463_00844 [Pseudomonas sp. URIL14HWK12:I9]